ncbi:MAG: AAA family ATPase [Acidimicrobiales bacterium]
MRAHTDAGRSAQVLAPTAVAASRLGDAVGVPGQTMAKALWSWDHRMNRPSAGDLILIDEASMATMIEVGDAVRVAEAHGGLVAEPRSHRDLEGGQPGGQVILQLLLGGLHPGRSHRPSRARTSTARE